MNIGKCTEQQMHNNSQNTINDKMTENRIFDLKYKAQGQKKFPWIYMNSTSVEVYNTNKSLI